MLLFSAAWTALRSASPRPMSRPWPDWAGWRLTAQSNPWGPAVEAASISSPEAAQAGAERGHHARHPHLAAGDQPVRTGARRMWADRTLDRSPTWAQVIQLWKDVAATLEVFEASVFTLPLADLATALAPASKGAFGRAGASIGNRSYRQAKKDVLAHWKSHKPKSRELHAAVQQAAAIAAYWSQLCCRWRTAPAPG